MQLRDDELQVVWKDLSALIASLPEEEQVRYQGAFRKLVHDIRHCIGVISSAEALLRRDISESPAQVELLDSIQATSQHAIGLVTDLSQPFDYEIPLPQKGQNGEPESKP